MRTRTFAVGCFASLVLFSPLIVFAAPGGPLATCQPINSIPATITSSGVYCLTKNVSTSMSAESDAAIRINADDVVLDLRQHVVDDSAAGLSTMASGILAQDRHNITVRNGTIHGFRIAILLRDTAMPYTDSGGHLVTGMRILGSTLAGIGVDGRGNRVVNNVVLNTGGGGSSNLAYEVVGIGWSGPGARILGNDIINVHNTTAETTKGIAMGDFYGPSVAGSIVKGNRISNLYSTVSGWYVYGIARAEGEPSVDGIVIDGNTITDAGTAGGGAESRGINLGAGAVCRDNTIFRFSSGIVGDCMDGGGNYYSP